MRIQEIDYGAAAPIDGYGPGFFRIGGEVFQGSQLCLPSGVKSWDGIEDVATLLAAAEEVDVLLLGMGAEIAPLPREIRLAFEEAGVGVELMASPSAARTYNVLLAEGRRVGAALIAI